jgi:hypothetical protein
MRIAQAAWIAAEGLTLDLHEIGSLCQGVERNVPVGLAMRLGGNADTPSPETLEDFSGIVIKDSRKMCYWQNQIDMIWRRLL